MLIGTYLISVMKLKNIKYIESIFEKVSIIVQIAIFVRQYASINHQ
jgi:hypothetical protein